MQHDPMKIKQHSKVVTPNSQNIKRLNESLENNLGQHGKKVASEMMMVRVQ